VSDIIVTGLGIRAGILAEETNQVVPLLNMMRYCGDDKGLIGISMTMPACVAEEEERKPSSLIRAYAMSKHKG
jgi:hypothetical protein